MTQTQTAHPTRASSSTYALEIKDGKGQLTEDEAAWWCEWSNQAGGALVVVRSAEDALRAIGAI